MQYKSNKRWTGQSTCVYTLYAYIQLKVKHFHVPIFRNSNLESNNSVIPTSHQLILVKELSNLIDGIAICKLLDQVENRH